MSYFPLFLDIGNIKFLIVGAGNIGLAKLEGVLEFSDKVTVLSKEFDEQSFTMINQNNLTYIQKKYKKKFLKGFDVVIAATNQEDVNGKIAKDCRKLGILVNVVDEPKNSDFIFGANVKKENIIISAGTSGMSPVLARILKQKINLALPKNLDLFNDFVTKNRDIVRKKLTDLQARRIFWQDLLEGVIGNEIAAGNIDKAQELFNKKFDDSKNEKKGAVYFLGAGPGDPELITLKAINFLSRADVVLYDRLVSEEILIYARRDAIKINVGKKKDLHRYKQNEINELLKHYASKGNIVARLKGGDSTIFARLSEEIDAINDLDVTYQVVPGVTAASAAGAYCGIPLTSRDSNKSVRFITIYEEDFGDDDYWSNLAQGNDALVLYMSSNNLSLISQNLAKAGMNVKTPIAIIEQVSTPYQKTYITNIADFDKDLGGTKFVSPSIVIIGEIVHQHKIYKWKEENLTGTYFKNLRKREANAS
jgi:uroporphyrin-III C-methyltransferase/precorrin-2 dehydrogenase/sirohydrochlorin ferrochelatase